MIFGRKPALYPPFIMQLRFLFRTICIGLACGLVAFTLAGEPSSFKCSDSDGCAGLSGTMVESKERSEQDLFASGDFSQWRRIDGRAVSNRWTITNGTVHRGGFRPGDIVTVRHYQDFDLSFEWKISHGGNSGVKYRTRGSLGPEYQILDDAHHPDASEPSHRAVSLYGLVAAPESKMLKPVGEWNHGRIVAKGKHIEHWINGEKVIDVNLSDETWKDALSDSKFQAHADFGHWKGPILLQDHGDEVWFRNLLIREL